MIFVEYNNLIFLFNTINSLIFYDYYHIIDHIRY